MKLVLTILFLLQANQAFSRNELCQKAHIQSFNVLNQEDLCKQNIEELSADAKNFIEKITLANQQIIKTLKITEEEPFSKGLHIHLKVTDLGVMDSEYKKNESGDNIILGTLPEQTYDNFSKFVYIHEMGHWYLNSYLVKKFPKINFINHSIFHEFFADLLVISILGDLDTSDIKAPKCTREIRQIGPSITNHLPIGEFDIASYFRNSQKCCELLEQRNEHTDFSQSICGLDLTMQNSLFANGLIPYRQTPLSLGLAEMPKDHFNQRLEAHRVSTPMNSFMKELSVIAKKAPIDLVFEELISLLNQPRKNSCYFKEVKNMGINDLAVIHEMSDADEIFKRIPKYLPTQELRTIHSSLFEKYGMQTSQEILREEAIELAKFYLANKLENKILKVYQEKTHEALNNWSCIDPNTNTISCKLEFHCEKGPL
jgi:hypothetical protein